MPAVSSPQPCCDETVAKELLRDDPTLISSLDFGAFVRQGVGTGPSLLIGDQSEIPLLAAATRSHLEYRMALLAHPGDHVMLRHRDRDFEEYLGTHLGLAELTFHKAGCCSRASVTQWAWSHPKRVAGFAQLAEQGGGLTIKSYLTTGHTWRLAQAIGQTSKQIIHVYGPSLRITGWSNDKLWFAQLARRVLGTEATPPTRAAYGPAAAAGLVRQISKMSDQVIVKVPDSAGSTGNMRLDSMSVRGRPLRDLKQMLLSRLYAVGWHDSYPVLVGVWDRNVVCSPSVQLWLPHLSAGQPVVEGIFEQRVQTSAAQFVGASRSALGREIQASLRREGTRIATVLQQLGYYGRCSLDAVICRTKDQSPLIHWIECNGRWGAVSIPVTAARQLLRHRRPSAMSILQEVLPDRDISTQQLMQGVRDMLLKVGRDTSGLIVLSPPSNPKGALLNLCAVAETQSAADTMLDEVMNRLTKSGQM
ncbi:preATP grasp domain-containing protein [Roseobacter weihaiensis]|uniref:preATP grasp domain-containing protein n=1 Tax=Roseobacter weihaiensis TaxID=2763262 RepID=UPI001D0B7C9D|nr:hypothetical protein [Roseobacter sp. H9]